jgi:hypothetical protein
MDDEKGTTIISADYMYLVFLGDDKIMTKLVDKLNESENIIDNEDSKTKNNLYKLNKKNRNKLKYIYIKTEADDPCINVIEDSSVQKILTDEAVNIIKKKHNDNTKSIDSDEIDANKKYIIMDEGVETTQCLTYADLSYSIRYDKKEISDLMMLMVMVRHETHYKLSFPILQLDEEEDPAELIENWLKLHDLKGLIKELIISPVNIIKNEHDILIFSAIVH